jgi:hypothetical protein
MIEDAETEKAARGAGSDLRAKAPLFHGTSGTDKSVPSTKKPFFINLESEAHCESKRLRRSRSRSNYGDLRG